MGVNSPVPSSPSISAMRSTTQRLGHARDEALAEAIEIEVAVEVAREADERAAVVVAVAVERAVERRLDGVLHRAREQHDHQRGEQRDDAAVLVRLAGDDVGREPQQQQVDAQDRPSAALYTSARFTITSTSISR
jgi:hypothetical protein